MNRTRGDVALVTGAGRGIGRGIAARLAGDGVHVVIADHDKALAHAATETIRASGGSCEALVVDVSDRTAVLTGVNGILERHSRLDVVVNNAMSLHNMRIVDVTEDVLDRMVSVGLKAMFWTMQACIPSMTRQGGGVIVNISSPAASRGIPGASVYSAVKGAVASLTRQASQELGPLGIRVNGVVPGAVPTEGTRALVDEAGYEQRRAASPLGRLGTPEDVGAAVSWLISDDARFVTGHLLAVDGGLLSV